MPTAIRDYTPLLRQAIAEAKVAGFDVETSELEASCFEAAFTTSSEELSEHGLAIRQFLKATRGALPRTTKAKLQACLIEIDLVWPGWRKLVALMKRRGIPG